MGSEIKEIDFINGCERSLRNFAKRISLSGLTLYEIAGLAGLNWKTVYNAANGVPVRFENAERIKLVLRRYGDGERNVKTGKK